MLLPFVLLNWAFFSSEPPNDLLAALLSGLGHPVISLEHLAFVLASGLVAIGIVQGFIIPSSFVFATLVGTCLHFLGWNLPASEVAIAASVLAFGVLLTLRSSRDHPSQSYNLTLSILAAVAGIFHGYVYGETIVEETLPLLISYLAGLAIVQLAIALGVIWVGDRLLRPLFHSSFPTFRLLGLAIGAFGVVCLNWAITG